MAAEQENLPRNTNVLVPCPNRVRGGTCDVRAPNAAAGYGDGSAPSDVLSFGGRLTGYAGSFGVASTKSEKDDGKRRRRKGKEHHVQQEF